MSARPSPAPGNRVFLFLQGPHGPFFHSLARMLREAGCTVWRVGFNAGDRAFWFHRASYIPFRDRAEDWPARIAALIAEKGATDLVLYGD
ncbi:MAG: capsule biosynthesis protein CapA, partial [Paracoccaceae bacterium]|nr:capsule biosynthesis protein CapA [Paracoccaceae bacterium]